MWKNWNTCLLIWFILSWKEAKKRVREKCAIWKPWTAAVGATQEEERKCFWCGIHVWAMRCEEKVSSQKVTKHFWRARLFRILFQLRFGEVSTACVKLFSMSQQLWRRHETLTRKSLSPFFSNLITISTLVWSREYYVDDFLIKMTTREVVLSFSSLFFCRFYECARLGQKELSRDTKASKRVVLKNEENLFLL